MFARRCAAVAALALPLYGIVTVGVANAATTFVVDDDGMASATNCNVATATPYTSIQAGVTAASAGDTVKVCPGTYAERVTIDKQLILRGAKAGVDARNRTGTASESVVDPADGTALATFDIRASGVSLDGFYLTGNVDGPAVQTAPNESGYRVQNNVIAANSLGMIFSASGTSTSTVSRNSFADNNQGLGVVAAAGNGIYSDQGLSDVRIDANRFRNNLNAAILVAGAASGVTVSNNNSMGDGTLIGVFAPGSDYLVINNVVANSGGSGIFFSYASDVAVQRNRVTDSAFSGIRIRESVGGVTVVSNNTSNGGGDHGIFVSTEIAGAVTVQNNTTNSNTLDGILFSAETSGNIIRSNTSRFNGNIDCEDDSTGTGTAATANTWSGNRAATSDPAGLCRPRR